MEPAAVAVRVRIMTAASCALTARARGCMNRVELRALVLLLLAVMRRASVVAAQYETSGGTVRAS